MRRWNSLRNKNKARSEKKHARRRFAEHFDKELSNHDYDTLVKQIKDNKAEFVEKQSNRVSVFKVKTGDITAIAVYDKSRKTIITFITEEMAKSGIGRIQLDEEKSLI